MTGSSSKFALEFLKIIDSNSYLVQLNQTHTKLELKLVQFYWFQAFQNIGLHLQPY